MSGSPNQAYPFGSPAADFLEYVQEAIGALNLGKLSTPIKSPSNANEVVFTGFGIRTPGDTFQTAWKIDVDENSEARHVKAFSAGAIHYVPGPLASLILRSADVFGELIRRDTLPAWFPIPQYIIYRGIDPNSLEARIREYLNANPWIRVILQRKGFSAATNFAQEFISGALPPIPVQAGELLGEAGPPQSGRRIIHIEMQKELGNTDNLFLDPAIYHRHWAEFFVDLANHPLKDSFTRPFAGPVANGAMRYVSKTGSDSSPYDTPSKAANDIQDAVNIANPYDTVVITDASTYDEGDEIDINKPITVTSLNLDNAIDNPAPNFPKLDGDEDHRVIRIHDTSGVVSVCNVDIGRGRVEHAMIGGPSSPEGGAGILIADAHQTYIRNCHIHNNATGEGIGENGFGGGIYLFHSSAYIYQNRIDHNTTIERGAGLGIWGYAWPVIEGNKIHDNQALGLARGDGGGVAIEVAVLSRSGPRPFNPDDIKNAKLERIRLIRNRIENNSAEDDGGGVYMTAVAQAEFVNNEILNNISKRGAGGAHASFGSNIVMKGDFIHDNQGNIAHYGENGGGGIYCRNTSLLLADVRIEDNVSDGQAGGGIYITDVAEGGLANVFDGYLRVNFGIDLLVIQITGSQGYIRRNHSTHFTGQVDDLRKGGGIYALRHKDSTFTGLPITISIDDITQVSNNQLDPSARPVTSPNSTNIHIDDFVHTQGMPVNDANKNTFMTGNRFVYNSR